MARSLRSRGAEPDAASSNPMTSSSLIALGRRSPGRGRSDVRRRVAVSDPLLGPEPVEPPHGAKRSRHRSRPHPRAQKMLDVLLDCRAVGRRDGQVPVLQETLVADQVPAIRRDRVDAHGPSRRRARSSSPRRSDRVEHRTDPASPDPESASVIRLQEAPRQSHADRSSACLRRRRLPDTPRPPRAVSGAPRSRSPRGRRARGSRARGRSPDRWWSPRRRIRGCSR